MELLEFKSKLEEIDKYLVAKEVVWWLVNKIPTYIDNHQTTYTLSFLSDEQNMKETSKAERLGNSLNAIELDASELANFDEEIENNLEVKKESEMIDLLKDFMEDVRGVIIENKEWMEEFYKALSFYYSTVAYYKAKPISKDLKGYIEIEYLGFENVKMDVYKTPLVPIKNTDGEIVDYKRDESKKELISKMPPSFCVDFGIVFWETQEEFSLF